jgi:hypothetical protein
MSELSSQVAAHHTTAAEDNSPATGVPAPHLGTPAAARRSAAPRTQSRIGRLGNVIVRAVLRSPAHRLLSGSMMIICLRGRRTGQTREVPVIYARLGSRLWVYCQRAERKSWWRNLRVPQPVTIWLRGRAHAAVGQAIEGRVDPQTAAVAMNEWLRHYPRAARHVGITLDPAGEPDPAALQEVAARSVLVKFQLDEPA